MTDSYSKPLLQISIPTYNRTSSLGVLLNDLRSLSDLVNDGKLGISVFDNSDHEFVRANKELVGSFGTYSHNYINIGFGGNVKRCLLESRGEFTWVVSDDDKLIISEIRNVLKKLSEIKEKVAGIAIPCAIPVQGTKQRLKVIGLKDRYGETNSFYEIIDPCKLPFDYLGSFIIKTKLLDANTLESLSLTNCYFQSLAYCATLNRLDEVYVHDQPAVIWVGAENIRWSIASLLQSRNELITAIVEKFGTRMNRDRLYIEVMRWGIFSKAGLYKMNHSFTNVLDVLIFSSKNFSTISHLYLLLYLLPSVLLKPLFVLIFGLKQILRQLRKFKF